MLLSTEELNEFAIEAKELLDMAEKSLLELEGGAEFQKNYDCIFRAFHNLKGSAGMLELNELQAHVHHLETELTKNKDLGSLSKELIDFFFKGCDGARAILDGRKAEPVAAPVNTPASLPKPVPAPAPIPVTPASTTTESSDPIHFILKIYPDLMNYLTSLGDEEKAQKIKLEILGILAKVS